MWGIGERDSVQLGGYCEWFPLERGAAARAHAFQQRADRRNLWPPIGNAILMVSGRCGCRFAAASMGAGRFGVFRIQQIDYRLLGSM